MAINFESSWEKEKAKKQVKEQRDWILEEAKRDFEHRQWKKEQAEKRGEGTWMLPELEESLSKKSSKKKKKEKKSKKKKKDKKKKKKKRKDSSSSSDSDSDSEEEQWVEKKAEDEAEAKVKGPQLERDSWMMDSAMESLFGGESQAEKRAKRDKEKEEKAKLAAMIEEPGQHKLELNPYWRDGGAGLPAEVAAQKLENPVLGGVATYGAVEWLKKALKRCEDQAKEEGRSVEEIAAERHGSLEELKERLQKTEEAYRQSLRREPTTSRGGFQRRFKRPGEDNDEGDSRRRFRRPDDDSDRRDRRSRSRERRRSRSRDRRSRSSDRRSRSRERRRSRSRDRSGSRDRKPQRDRRSRSRDRSPDRERRRRSRERSRSRDRERRRSRSRERRSRSRDRSDFSSRLKGRFRRPGEEGERAYARPTTSAPAWKKPGFQKPGEEKAAERKPSPPKKQERKKSPSPSSSSSSSEEESSESEEEPVRELSEQEKNELGAKIMRAELMGNEALAAKLKAELNAAQNPKPPKASKPKKKKPSKEDDDDDDESKVVLLTQTTRKGIVRPMGEEGNAVDGGGVGKSRRKKRKMATHDKDGQRERYFADDDRHDLKSMVHAEKMGTAEDSNMMFARLAGRSMEKTDDDHQLDDVMLQRATKANKTIEDERARAKAIMEHRKTSKCMERCRYCFDNVAKHLIVAIGSKCYLALPQHVSLTEGHCLVVPMQHVASGTAMDEDVWMEIQTFRKLLTKMFRERDEDVMFMETSSSMDGHMVLECVPVPIEIGDMAPIYFKKAIDECEGMWADNKKLVNLSNKDVRAAVPKGFPYFAVDFGLQGGYAHVLEDARTFPAYFGREIVGGMLDVEPTLWRKPRKENFDDARKKVLQFASMWKPYDWTKKKKDLSDSD